jgi:uncharacterized membrane protein
MQPVRRIFAWAMEMLLQAILLIVFLGFIDHVDIMSAPKDFAKVTIGALIFFGISGYAVTTLLARLLWRVKALWSYPVAASVLFLFHFQLLNFMSSSGLQDAHGRMLTRIFGVCLVFLITLLGSALLTWTKRQTLGRETVNLSAPEKSALR